MPDALNWKIIAKKSMIVMEISKYNSDLQLAF